MDEFDAPRKLPVENSDLCIIDLKEIEEQTCQLFEEFLSLDDAILDAPSPVNHLYNDEEEKSDSPVYVKSTKTIGVGFEQCELEEDDLVPDSGPLAPSVQNLVAESGDNRPDPNAGNPKMKELAIELRKAGDSFVDQFGPKVQNVEGKLLQLVKQEAANLTYDRFSMAVDDLVGKDKDWTTFVFAFCIGRRVCKHSQEAYQYTKNYFQQYISQSYSETLRDSGGVETFLRTHGSSMTQ